MKSSIYISFERIEVIGYNKSGQKISIAEYVTYPLPEGIMINGKIIDQPVLTECLSDLRSQYPKLFTDPTLIVDGSTILTKRITVPKLTQRQYARLVREEFSDTAENLDELVCDYHLLHNTATKTMILACAVEKTQVESYMAAFREAGIKLKAIHIGVQALLNHVNTSPALRETIAVLNVIDGVTMLSMLFDKGQNVFMSRARLYSEDQAQLAQDVLSSLSGLIQFNKSEKFNDIAKSFYLGLSDNDIKLMNTINPYPDIALAAPDIFIGVNGAEKFDQHVHLAFLNIWLGEDSIDLIRSYTKLGKIKRQQRPKPVVIPVIAGTIVVLAIPFIILFIKTVNLELQLLEVNAYLTDEAVVAKSTEIDEIIAQTAQYNGIITQFDEKTETENARAAISGQILDLITKTNSQKVTINQFSFDESTSLVHVNGSSATDTDTAEYIDLLKQSRLVESINYAGYSYNSLGEYVFSIDVKIAVE